MSTKKVRLKVFSPTPKILLDLDALNSQDDMQDLKTPSTPTEQVLNPFKISNNCPPTPSKTPSKRRRSSGRHFAIIDNNDNFLQIKETPNLNIVSPAKRRLVSNFLDDENLYMDTKKKLLFNDDNMESETVFNFKQNPVTPKNYQPNVSNSPHTPIDFNINRCTSPDMCPEYEMKDEIIEESFSDDEIEVELSGQTSTPPSLSQRTEPVIQRIPIFTPSKIHVNPFSPAKSYTSDKHERCSTPTLEFEETQYPKRRRHTVCNVVPQESQEIEIESYYSRYYNDFIELQILGQGSFGTVTRCKNRIDGMEYAIKQTKREINGEKDATNVLKEVHALSTLVNNPYIVRYFGAWMENNVLFVQTELCEGGSLTEAIAKKGSFSEPELLQLLRQIATGLYLMHERQLVHLDIKPDNIYIVDGGRYKIGDLGLVASTTDTTRDISEGDARYLAKEVLNDITTCDLTKVDIFALGATIYEAIIGSPLPANGEEWENIRNGQLNEYALKAYSPNFVNLLKRLLHKNPNLRPSAEEILKHNLVAQSKLSYEQLEELVRNLQDEIKRLKNNPQFCK